MKASPPIIPEPQLSGFIHEVFGNLNQILTYHRAMLKDLFARQRDQHPLIQSVADIVLDSERYSLLLYRISHLRLLALSRQLSHAQIRFPFRIRNIHQALPSLRVSSPQAAQEEPCICHVYSIRLGGSADKKA